MQERRQPTISRMIAAIPETFVSDAVYREAARSWQGTGILYIFLLLVLVSVLMAGGMVYHLTRQIEDELPYFLDTFPELRISGGTLSLVEASPPVILNLQGQEAVIIDPSGTIASLEGQTAAILVTQRDVRVRWLADRELSFGFEDVADMLIGKEEVRGFVEEALSLFPFMLFPLAYVMILLSSLVWWLVQAVFYTLVGTMLLFKGRGQPPFTVGLRVTCVALTPAITVRAVFAMFGVTLAWSELFIVGIEVAYVFLALRSGFGKNDGPLSGPSARS